MNHSITIGGEALPVIIQKRRGMRRIVLRYQPTQHALRITLPRYVSLRQGLDFAHSQRTWIARQIEKKPACVPFADGQVIPILGRDYMLCHEGGRGVIRVEENRLCVPGDAGFMARRVREWIKARTKEAITALVQEKAHMIGKRAGKITLRDTSSVWGSCARNGNLSFSWRLAFAPIDVLEYLVCHEVAHLKHHNHRAAFWRVVAELCPNYKTAQRWLKTHGPRLNAYG